MLLHIARKAAIQILLVLVGVSTLLFLLMRLSGDPAAMMAGPGANPEIVVAMRQQMGLNEPLWIQYARFMQDAIRLDFGNSYRFSAAALPLVLARIPFTLMLASLVVAVSIAIGLPSGIWSAIHPESLISKVAHSLSYAAQAVPGFWLALLLVIIFAVRLRWLPTFGAERPEQIILPVLTLTPLFAARIMLMMNEGLRRTLDADYVRTAHAKGLPPFAVLRRHIVRNALISVVTLIGLEFAQLSGGAVITEVIYSWPGIGSFLVDAVLARDYAIVQASVFVIALAVMIVNLGVELSYRALDPRVA